MGATTAIEWATATFNPWIGCEKVSPACKHCYAERYGRRFGAGWGEPYRRTADGNWREPVAWNAKAKRARQLWAQRGAVGPAPERPRVFSASLADWLDAAAPVEWLADFLTLVAETPDLDWLLLSKRPGLWRERLGLVAGLRHGGTARLFVERWLEGDRPDNVWLGVTVEDQKRADERIPELLAIPARVRFLSCEPLLERINLTVDETVTFCNGCARYFRTGPDDCPVCGTSSLSGRERSYLESAELHWIIAGGESGTGARPSHPAWFRSLRDQAVAFGSAFLFKQWGEWGAGSAHPRDPKRERIMLSDGRLIELLSRYDVDGRWGSLDPNVMTRVGKREAGRLLDGRTWDELPRVRA